MNEKAEKIIAKSAYTVSEELKKINAFMCAEAYFNEYIIDETDVNKMLKELYFESFTNLGDDIQKQEKLEYIKKTYF